MGVLADFVSGGAWALETDQINLSLAPEEKKE